MTLITVLTSLCIYDIIFLSLSDDVSNEISCAAINLHNLPEINSINIVKTTDEICSEDKVSMLWSGFAGGFTKRG